MLCPLAPRTLLVPLLLLLLVLLCKGWRKLLERESVVLLLLRRLRTLTLRNLDTGQTIVEYSCNIWNRKIDLTSYYPKPRD